LGRGSAGMRILVGCCGVPGGLARYARTFPVVELNSTFYRLPRTETARRWRSSVPGDFVFCVKAFQGVTHPAGSPTWRRFGIPPGRQDRYGLLQDTPEVWDSWERTLEICGALRARAVLVQLPARFKDDSGACRAARRFFRKAPREKLEVAVELRGWGEAAIAALCADQDLIDVRDPFRGRPASFGPHRTAYLRLHGSPPGLRPYRYSYTAGDLIRLEEKIRSLPVREALVFFNNLSMDRDARAFLRRVSGPCA